MFAPHSEENVLLGIPTVSTELTATCYCSKIGGSPLWISKGHSQNELTSHMCEVCERNMLFTMQIYAPTEDLERALYLYCCPSQCASQSHGWKVVKDQCPRDSSCKGPEKLSSKDTTSSDNDLSKTKVLAECAPPVHPNFTLSGNFMDDDSDNDDDLSALTALLDARDNSLRSTTADSSFTDARNCSYVKSSKKGDEDCRVSHPLPPPPPSLSVPDDSDNHGTQVPMPGIAIERETLLTEVYESECSGSATTQSSHIDNLFSKYIDETISQGEEDPHVISLLQQQQQKIRSSSNKGKKQMKAMNSDSDDDFEDKDDEEFNNSIRQMQGSRKAMAIQQKQRDEMRQEKAKVKSAAEGGSGLISKREWSRRRKSEEFFQKRYSMAPSQVMRYAYGGEPLWCFLPAPVADIDKIPVCSSCNAPRVFELQIMPALIGFVEDAISQAAQKCGEKAFSFPSAAVRRSPLDLSSGFEFGVVCIWSCPNSCVDVYFEVPIVQPPSDLA